MQASRYHILGLIGQGQFGKVYCASDRRTGQLVALKELTHQRAPTNQFLQELWFIISLQHPNIAACRALEHIHNGRYLVMDYCEGGTLRHLLEQNHALRLQESLQLLIGVLEGLDYAHQRGIIHCDIKPENILLTLKPEGWHSKLSDFGIARHVPSTSKFSSSQKPSLFTGGSPAYMAPERFYGLYSPQSDLYAIGVVLYEILTGDRPFHGLPGELMWSQLNQRLQMPEFVPEPLQIIIQKALEKLPARRYSTALEMAEALQQALIHPQIQTQADTIISWQIQEDNMIEDLPPTPVIPTQNPEKLLAQTFPLSIVKSSQSPLIFTANCPYIYTAFEQKLEIWSQLQENNDSAHSNNPSEPKIQEKFKFSEPILSLVPINNRCLVLTPNRIYHFTAFQSSPQVLLNLSAIKPSSSEQQPSDPSEKLLSPVNSSDSQNSQDLDPQPSANLNYKIAIDPYSNYMALTLAKQLRFYRFTSNSNGSPLKLNKKISLSLKETPELLFLSHRYLLTAWLNFKQNPLNILRVYTRRGKPVGNLKLPIRLKQLLPLPQPYTLLGIGQDEQPFLVLLRLKPLSIIRIPLNEPPSCIGVTSWGFVIGNQNGQYTFFNLEGNPIGNYIGPLEPKAIAPFGKTGLAIATHTHNQANLHLIQSLNLGTQYE